MCLSHSQAIDAAHIAQHALPDVMDVVEFNLVADTDRRRIAPCPTDGYTRIEQIADVVVRYDIVTAMADPHTDGAMMNPPAMLNDAVVNGLKT